MKKLLVALLPLALTVSCGTALVLAGVGVVIGMWIAEDFDDAEGHVILNAPPEEVFEALRGVAESRPGATDLRIREGAMRMEWDEDQASVVAWVLLMPDTPEFSTLKITAYEMGVRGRVDLAQEIGEAVAMRF